MKFRADVYVMPLKELLDPQGKAVLESLQSHGDKSFEDIRIGKKISIVVQADNEEDAQKKIDAAAQSMLYNPVMESYEFTLSEL